MFNSTLCDMIARLNGAISHKKTNVSSRYSKLILEILNKLHKEKLIDNINIIEHKNKPGLYRKINYSIPKHNDMKPELRIMTKVRSASTPGRRMYINHESIRKTFVSFSEFWILSTNKGIKTFFESKKDRIGGELLLKIKYKCHIKKK